MSKAFLLHAAGVDRCTSRGEALTSIKHWYSRNSRPHLACILLLTLPAYMSFTCFAFDEYINRGSFACEYMSTCASVMPRLGISGLAVAFTCFPGFRSTGHHHCHGLPSYNPFAPYRAASPISTTFEAIEELSLSIIRITQAPAHHPHNKHSFKASVQERCLLSLVSNSALFRGFFVVWGRGGRMKVSHTRCGAVEAHQ